MDRAQLLRLAPQPLDLTGGRSELLDDEPRLFVVESGSIALFVAEHKSGKQAGPRHLVTRYGLGQTIVSARTASQDGLRFVIDAVGAGSVRAVRLADVLRRGPQDPGVARDLTQWIASVAHVFSELPGPSIPIRASGGEITLGASDTLRPEAGTTVWVSVSTGRVRMLGDETLVLDSTSGPFPLGHRMWIEATGLPARVRLCETHEVEDPAALVEGLTRMSAVVRAFLAQRLAREDAEEKQRLRERGLLRQAEMRDAKGALAAVLDGGARAIHDADPLLAAVRAIGASLGVTIRPAPAWEDPRRSAEPFDAIARASRLRTRQVVLSGEWWKRDCGNLLATAIDEPQRPVALLRTPGLAYVIFDPVRGTRTRVSRATARTLAPRAVMIYRPFPDGKLTLPGLFRFMVARRMRDFGWILLTGLAATLLGMVTPLVMAALMDRAVPDADGGLVIALGAALLVAAISGALFTLAQSIVLTRVGTISDSSTQAALWDRLLRLRPNFFREFSSGDLLSRMGAVAEVIHELNGAAIRSLFSSTLALVNLGLLFYYSARLALVAVAITLVALAFNAAVNSALLQRIRVLADLEGRFFGTLVQLVNGVTKLKVAGAHERTFVHWMRRYSEQLRFRAAAQRLADWVGVFNQVIPTASQALLFYFAYLLLIPDRASGAAAISLGTFLAFNAAYGAFVAGATELSNTLVGLLDTVIKARRVEPVLRAAPEVDGHKVDPGRLSGSLALERVSFRYRAKGAKVLDEVTVRAEPGEFVALVGPSGSGKSTILRVLLGFEEIESGLVSYDGQDLSGLDVHAVRRQLGVVLQAARLNTQSIFENIAGGNLLTLDEAWIAAEQAGLAEDIRAMPMGMHTIVSEGGSNLSGGQRQRLLIARSLALRPRVLFFDEATSALDNQTQAIVSDSLRRLRVTRLVIAHRLSTVRHADRIYVLEHGKVVEQGRFEELMDRGGLFARMMARQVA